MAFGARMKVRFWQEPQLPLQLTMIEAVQPIQLLEVGAVLQPDLRRTEPISIPVRYVGDLMVPVLTAV